MKIPIINYTLLHNLLAITKDVLNEYNIEWFGDGGTMLGAVRNEDIIPHDDDIDLGIFEQDEELMQKVLVEKLHDNFIKIKVINQDNHEQHTELTFPVKVQVVPYLTKVYIPDVWTKAFDEEQNKEITIGTPTLDIFTYCKEGKFVQLASVKHRKQFKNCFYKANEIYPLRSTKFGHQMINIVNKPTGYLFRYYGNDCLTKIKREVRNDDNPLLKNYI